MRILFRERCGADVLRLNHSAHDCQLDCEEFRVIMHSLQSENAHETTKMQCGRTRAALLGRIFIHPLNLN
jgi:hypothetical protein